MLPEHIVVVVVEHIAVAIVSHNQKSYIAIKNLTKRKTQKERKGVDTYRKKESKAIARKQKKQDEDCNQPCKQGNTPKMTSKQERSAACVKTFCMCVVKKVTGGELVYCGEVDILNVKNLKNI